MALTPRLDVQGATVSFSGRPALDTFSLTVEPGEVVAILGPSGSGKSTLLRAIAGLQPLGSGHIWLDGVDQSSIPPHRREVGLMFQDHALFPHRDVSGNIEFGLRMRGVGREDRRARVRELLALVDLDGFEGRMVATLSGGEQQRVALARALAPRPRLLLLDEPLGALDRPLRERLLGELAEVFRHLDQTVLAVTHDQGEAFALSDRVVLLDEGRLVQSGSPRQVWDRPVSRRAAELLGLPNLLSVPVRGDRALTAWGEVAVAEATAAEVTLYVPPAAVRLGGSKGTRATVTAVEFRGHTSRVVVAAPTGERLELATVGPAPGVGDTVTVRLSTPEVVVLNR